MKDINWHNWQDLDFEDLLYRYSNHDILAETNVTYRISNTKYFENGKLTDCEEILKRFAFLD